MNLKRFFNNLDPKIRVETKRQLAQYLEIHPNSVQHWINGTRIPSPLHALGIERFFKKSITKNELRPDIYPPEDKAA